VDYPPAHLGAEVIAHAAESRAMQNPDQIRMAQIVAWLFSGTVALRAALPYQLL
jgi:hypothetical protein